MTEIGLNNASKKGISGSTLKWIAIIIMIIDHTSAIIIDRILIQRGISELTKIENYDAFMQQNGVLYFTGLGLRMIGRIAFPIFIFLLIEGFVHTRNIKKYLIRLFLFALVSEIPFDFAFSGTAFSMGYQNVFFTLLIGMLVITGLHLVETKIEWSKLLRYSLNIVFIMAGAAAAEFMKLDYGMTGVIAIVLMYLFRRRKTASVCIGCASLLLLGIMEATAFLSVVPIRLYNGEKGKGNKWLFYVFYPLHILLLYLIACAMGLGSIMLR